MCHTCDACWQTRLFRLELRQPVEGEFFMWHERLRQIDAEGEPWVPPEVVEEVVEVVEVVQVEAADPEELALLRYARDK
jgi:S-adenosylmethionine:diacylglycerol 3-amino-3-carboxypropyl transferase